MNKATCIAKLAERTQSKPKVAEHYWDAVIQVLAEALSAGESLRLSGLGTFTAKARAARKGRNPQTGESLIIPASKAIQFNPSTAIKAQLNAKPDQE